MAKVSVLIPSRCERFLSQTVADVLAKARGEIEVVVNLDAYWPDPPLPNDPRLVVLHQPEQRGMRHGINMAARVARGDYFFKLDGHCMVEEGFDEILKADCDDDWVVVPRRRSLEPEAWLPLENGKSPVDAHFLSWPYERPGDRTCGLHGQVWNARARERINVLVDTELSSQGSAYFMSRKHWERTVGELGAGFFAPLGSFSNEFQEVGLKTQLTGGQVMVNKKTTYLHLFKGKRYGTGYNFGRDRWVSWAEEKERAQRFTIDTWLRDDWPARTTTFASVIEQFWPVPQWPDDWQAFVAKTPRFDLVNLAPVPDGYR